LEPVNHALAVDSAQLRDALSIVIAPMGTAHVGREINDARALIGEATGHDGQAREALWIRAVALSNLLATPRFLDAAGIASVSKRDMAAFLASVPDAVYRWASTSPVFHYQTGAGRSYTFSPDTNKFRAAITGVAEAESDKLAIVDRSALRTTAELVVSVGPRLWSRSELDKVLRAIKKRTHADETMCISLFLRAAALATLLQSKEHRHAAGILAAPNGDIGRYLDSVPDGVWRFACSEPIFGDNKAHPAIAAVSFDATLDQFTAAIRAH
jgi:hypothetical protein